MWQFNNNPRSAKVRRRPGLGVHLRTGRLDGTVCGSTLRWGREGLPRARQNRSLPESRIAGAYAEYPISRSKRPGEPISDMRDRVIQRRKLTGQTNGGVRGSRFNCLKTVEESARNGRKELAASRGSSCSTRMKTLHSVDPIPPQTDPGVPIRATSSTTRRTPLSESLITDEVVVSGSFSTRLARGKAQWQPSRRLKSGLRRV